MTDTLTALDATFLELEEQDEGALMSIGGVMVFDPLPEGGTPSLEEVRASLAGRLTQLPRYSQKLSSPHTGRLAWPHWIADEHFDIANHVRRAALPAPGGVRELCDWAADFYSHRLDRTRPLWEIALVEGLEHGRWAVAHKTHHCMVDGVGSVDVVHLLLDADPSPSEEPPTLPAAAPEEMVSHLIPTPPQPVVQAAEAGARAARAGFHAARHPRTALARSRSLAELLVRNELISAPRTSLNAPIGSARRFRVISIPLEQAKRVRQALGGSVNDVILAVCASGLRNLLLGRGETVPAQGLRAMVPMNVRQASEHLELGNRVSSLFVELPAAEPAAQTRYRRIVSETARLKSSGAATGATAMLDLAELAPPVVHAALARSQYGTRLFNVTITNVPGPQIPLYAFGAPLRELYPLVPLAAGHGVGIAIFSYNGVLSFGVAADAESVPDIDVLVEGLSQGIDELLALSSHSEPDGRAGQAERLHATHLSEGY